MKQLITLICVTLLTGATAFAQAPQTQEECQYDFPSAKSALDQKSPNFSSIKKPIKNNKQKILTQNAVLKKNKVKLTFTTGGCAHYGYTFTYSNLKYDSIMSDVAFTKAIELLKATPTTTEGQALTKTLIEALESSAMNKIFRPPNSIYDVPCGDAQCSLDASVKGELKASYSFPL